MTAMKRTIKAPKTGAKKDNKRTSVPKKAKTKKVGCKKVDFVRGKMAVDNATYKNLVKLSEQVNAKVGEVVCVLIKRVINNHSFCPNGVTSRKQKGK